MLKKLSALSLIFTFLSLSLCLADSDLSKTSKFMLGATTGLVIHEAGHFAAIKLTGTKGTWESPVCFRFKNKPSPVVASAGIIANMATTEIILNTNTDKDNWYILGLLTFSILEPIVYVFRDQTGHNAPDIESMHKGGLSRDIVIPVIFGHTIFSTYRVFTKNKLPLNVKFKINRNRCGVVFVASF